jgi:flavorubredoxin
MRVGVVFFADRNRQGMLALARGLGAGIESQGHQVEVIDGIRDVNTKLTSHQYTVVGTESLSITGKIPARVGPFLASAGMIQGKRCYAFVAKSFLGSSRALIKLMRAMEHEGMYLKNSGVLKSPEEARAIGAHLRVG